MTSAGSRLDRALRAGAVADGRGATRGAVVGDSEGGDSVGPGLVSVSADPDAVLRRRAPDAVLCGGRRRPRPRPRRSTRTSSPRRRNAAKPRRFGARGTTSKKSGECVFRGRDHRVRRRAPVRRRGALKKRRRLDFANVLRGRRRDALSLSGRGNRETWTSSPGRRLVPQKTRSSNACFGARTKLFGIRVVSRRNRGGCFRADGLGGARRLGRDALRRRRTARRRPSAREIKTKIRPSAYARAPPRSPPGRSPPRPRATSGWSTWRRSRRRHTSGRRRKTSRRASSAASPRTRRGAWSRMTCSRATPGAARPCACARRPRTRAARITEVLTEPRTEASRTRWRA